jgi:hypothetical protein
MTNLVARLRSAADSRLLPKTRNSGTGPSLDEVAYLCREAADESARLRGWLEKAMFWAPKSLHDEYRRAVEPEKQP